MSRSIKVTTNFDKFAAPSDSVKKREEQQRLENLKRIQEAMSDKVETKPSEAAPPGRREVIVPVRDDRSVVRKQEFGTTLEEAKRLDEAAKEYQKNNDIDRLLPQNKDLKKMPEPLFGPKRLNPLDGKQRYEELSPEEKAALEIERAKRDASNKEKLEKEIKKENPFISAKQLEKEIANRSRQRGWWGEGSKGKKGLDGYELGVNRQDISSMKFRQLVRQIQSIFIKVKNDLKEKKHTLSLEVADESLRAKRLMELEEEADRSFNELSAPYVKAAYEQYPIEEEKELSKSELDAMIRSGLEIEKETSKSTKVEDLLSETEGGTPINDNISELSFSQLLSRVRVLAINKTQELQTKYDKKFEEINSKKTELMQNGTYADMMSYLKSERNKEAVEYVKKLSDKYYSVAAEAYNRETGKTITLDEIHTRFVLGGENPALEISTPVKAPIELRNLNKNNEQEEKKKRPAPIGLPKTLTEQDLPVVTRDLPKVNSLAGYLNGRDVGTANIESIEIKDNLLSEFSRDTKHNLFSESIDSISTGGLRRYFEAGIMDGTFEKMTTSDKGDIGYVRFTLNGKFLKERSKELLALVGLSSNDNKEKVLIVQKIIIPTGANFEPPKLDQAVAKVEKQNSPAPVVSVKEAPKLEEPSNAKQNVVQDLPQKGQPVSSLMNSLGFTILEVKLPEEKFNNFLKEEINYRIIPEINNGNAKANLAGLKQEIKSEILQGTFEDAMFALNGTGLVAWIEFSVSSEFLRSGAQTYFAFVLVSSDGVEIRKLHNTVAPALPKGNKTAHFNAMLRKKAQQSSSQAGDVPKALERRGLWNLSDAIAPQINKAKISDETSLSFGMIVDKNLRITYTVTGSPSLTPAQTSMLTKFLASTFGAKQSAALKEEGINVTDTLTVGWLTF